LEGHGLRRSADDLRFRCASLISDSQASSSEIWTYRFRGVKNFPTSGVVNVKWRAGTNTRIPINSN